MPSDKHVVSVEELTGILCKAKAGVPSPKKLRDLADAMTMMGAHYLGTAKGPRTVWAEITFRKGMLKARRPGHMKWHLVPKGPLWPNPRSGKRPLVWHLEAKLLLQLYRRDVKTAGVWRDGPPMRFIQLALERIGLGRHETRTIEEALKRSETK